MKREQFEQMLAKASAAVKRLNQRLAIEIPNPGAESTAPVKAKKRLRQSKRPLLNKLEAEFKQFHEQHTGYTLIPQSIRFRLGNGIWFKPDFVQFCPTMGVTAYEVKGPHAFRGGFENLKVAASLYHRITWVLVWKDESGRWRQQVVLP